MEAVVVCVDNSEFTRNGDYAPTRFQAQADAVNLLAGAKTQSNPENVVGVLSLAGKTPRVLVTLTPDLGKVLNAMSEVEISGETNLTAGLQIAQLALKHRQNKNGRAKLVLFIGSPIRESTEDLVKLGKKLKKNSVAVDVVSFGGESDNDAKLEAFHQAVNGEGGEGHLLVVPAGGPVLADYLISSPLFGGEEGGNPFGAAAGGGGGFEFGFDPSLDPELALALRVSMEEEQARLAAAGGGEVGAKGEGASAPAAGPSAPSDAMDLDEDALMQQAIALSMQHDAVVPADTVPAPAAQPAPAAPDPAPGMMDMDNVEDEELRLAMEMSMAEAQEAANKALQEKKDKEKKDKDAME